MTNCCTDCYMKPDRLRGSWETIEVVVQLRFPLRRLSLVHNYDEHIDITADASVGHMPPACGREASPSELIASTRPFSHSWASSTRGQDSGSQTSDVHSSLHGSNSSCQTAQTRHPAFNMARSAIRQVQSQPPKLWHVYTDVVCTSVNEDGCERPRVGRSLPQLLLP